MDTTSGDWHISINDRFSNYICTSEYTPECAKPKMNSRPYLKESAPKQDSQTLSSLIVHIFRCYKATHNSYGSITYSLTYFICSYLPYSAINNSIYVKLTYLVVLSTLLTPLSINRSFYRSDLHSYYSVHASFLTLTRFNS